MSGGQITNPDPALVDQISVLLCFWHDFPSFTPPKCSTSSTKNILNIYLTLRYSYMIIQIDGFTAWLIDLLIDWLSGLIFDWLIVLNQLSWLIFDSLIDGWIFHVISHIMSIHFPLMSFPWIFPSCSHGLLLRRVCQLQGLRYLGVAVTPRALWELELLPAVAAWRRGTTGGKRWGKDGWYMLINWEFQKWRFLILDSCHVKVRWVTNVDPFTVSSESRCRISP